MASNKRKRDSNVLNGFKKNKKFKSAKKNKMRQVKSINKSWKKFMKRQADKGDGTNVVATYQKKSGTSVAREGRPRKKVKVSRDLRNKIKKVIQNEKGIGWYKEVYYPAVPIGLTDNAQKVFGLGDGLINNGGVGLNVAFNPLMVYKAYATLFKTISYSSPGSTSVGIESGDQAIRIRVIDSNVVYRIKNNTARGVTLKLYDCSLKTPGPTATSDAAQHWLNWNTSEALLDSGVNVDTLITTLYNSPKFSPGFMKMYSVDETIVLLEAGKEYNHKLTGPKDMVYDYAKLGFSQTNAAGFSDVQRMNKFTFGVAYSDLAAAATGAGGRVGRITDIDGSNAYGLLVETTHFYRIGVSEHTGVFLSASPTPPQDVSLNLRRNAFAIKVYPPTIVATPVVIQDEGPGTAPPAGSV